VFDNRDVKTCTRVPCLSQVHLDIEIYQCPSSISPDVLPGMSLGGCGLVAGRSRRSPRKETETAMQAEGGQSRAMDPDEMRELETAIRTTMVQISPPGTVEPVVNRRAGSTLSPPRMPPRTTSLREEPMPTASPPKYPDLVPKNAAVNLATAAAMVAGGGDDDDDDDDDAYLEIAPDPDADGQWSGARASQIADDTLTSEASGSTFAATPGGPVRPVPVANQPIVVAMVDPAPQEDPPRGVAAWLLDFVRLVTLFGAVLVLSSAPFTLFELGR
jgi:hypothetical protein